MAFPHHLLANSFENFSPLRYFAMEEHISLLQQSNVLLIQKNIQLEKELVKLKEWKSSTMREQTQTDQPENAQIQEVRAVKRKYNARRANLDKKFKCHIENCPRKYSSRIALNSHLRKKHKLFNY